MSVNILPTSRTAVGNGSSKQGKIRSADGSRAYFHRSGAVLLSAHP